MNFSGHRREQRYQSFFLVAVLSLIGLQLYMIPRVNFNWDEFNELTVLFAKDSGYAVGCLRHGLHYLTWPLRYVPFREDILLTIARYWSFGIGVLGIYYMVFKIASTVKTPLLGSIAVFLTATFSTFFESSIQYRTDPFTTFFFLIGFYLVLRAGTDRPPWLIPGLLIGIAMFINPKSLYHFLTLLSSYAYYCYYTKRKKEYLLITLHFVSIAIVSLIILLIFHNLFYNIVTHRVAGSVVAAARLGFGHIHGWPTKVNFVLGSITKSFFPAACILTGSVLGLRHMVTNYRAASGTNLVTIGALLQVFTVLVHQGTYKYYIINILPLLAILGAFPLYRIIMTILDYRKNAGKGSSIWISRCILAFFVVGCLLGIVARLHINLSNTTVNQRLHIKYLHHMFPNTISYADGFGLLSKYRNILQWVSTKSLILYHRKGKAFFQKHFEKDFPVLIIESLKFSVEYLLPEDQEFIRQNFVPYFGQKFWIYGFQISGEMLRDGARIDLRVSGPYTIDGARQDLLIDGRPARTPIRLKAGFHDLRCQHECDDITLTYGEQSIDEVIPNFTLKPNSSGTIETMTPGRYYLANDLSEINAGLVIIDSLSVNRSQELENQVSIYLDAGNHAYKNPIDNPLTFHLIGPSFLPFIHRS